MKLEYILDRGTSTTTTFGDFDTVNPAWLSKLDDTDEWNGLLTYLSTPLLLLLLSTKCVVINKPGVNC
jgi:hypothetical protein